MTFPSARASLGPIGDRLADPIIAKRDYDFKICWRGVSSKQQVVTRAHVDVSVHGLARKSHTKNCRSSEIMHPNIDDAKMAARAVELSMQAQYKLRVC